MRILFCFFIFIVIQGNSFQFVYAQKTENYSNIEHILSDFRSRKYDEKIILNLKEQINKIENNINNDFQDSIYVLYVSLLANALIQNGNLNEAEKTIKHSVYFIEKRQLDLKKEQLAIFYMSYGLIESLLNNYNIAKQKYEIADSIIFSIEGNSEYRAVALSYIAAINCELGLSHDALKQIEKCIDIVKGKEGKEGKESFRNKLKIYQKAGTIYFSNNDSIKGIYYTNLVYEQTKNKAEYATEFINAAINMSVFYLNNCEFEKSINVSNELEKLNLTLQEKIIVYNFLFYAYLGLKDVNNSSKYCALDSKLIHNKLSQLYINIPFYRIEDVWKEEIIQLQVNMGIIEFCKNRQEALQMCYDNCLYIKTLNTDYFSKIKKLVKDNVTLSKIYNKIKELRLDVFSNQTGNTNETINKLNVYEQDFLDIQKNATTLSNIQQIKWSDIKNNLNNGEYAIELFCYNRIDDIVINKTSTPVKLGALIISNKSNNIIFEELCSHDQIFNIYTKAIKKGEYGINALYSKDSPITLYNLLWKNIEPHVADAKTIYISPIHLAQSINFSYIVCPDNNYLCNKYDIRMITSTANIMQDNSFHNLPININTFGGCEYENKNKKDSKYSAFRSIVLEELSDRTRGTYKNLIWTSAEVDSINAILTNSNYHVITYKGQTANEYNFRNMDGASPQILHFSTHGFYLDGIEKFSVYKEQAKYFNNLSTYYRNDQSLLYTGILLSCSNVPFNYTKEDLVSSDGVITSEEISLMDFSNTKLVVLAGCKTGIGYSIDGYGGLVKAFKYAGAKSLLVSLWNVPDYVTHKLMIQFYKNLCLTDNAHKALLKAQQQISITYPDPFYWAGFVVLD